VFDKEKLPGYKPTAPRSDVGDKRHVVVVQVGKSNDDIYYQIAEYNERISSRRRS
jgi:hypothetical protein